MTPARSDLTADEVAELIKRTFKVGMKLRRHGEILAADVGQTYARMAVLSVLQTGEKSVPQIARELQFARPSVQRVLDPLVEDGLIVALPNPAHAKSPLLRLTESGNDVCDAFVANAAEEQIELGKQLDRDEVEAALRVLQTLANLAD